VEEEEETKHLWQAGAEKIIGCGVAGTFGYYSAILARKAEGILYLGTVLYCTVAIVCRQSYSLKFEVWMFLKKRRSQA
jgi:hypothetical protein